jgi:hypothetical protein
MEIPVFHKEMQWRFEAEAIQIFMEMLPFRFPHSLSPNAMFPCLASHHPHSSVSWSTQTLHLLKRKARLSVSSHRIRILFPKPMFAGRSSTVLLANKKPLAEPSLALNCGVLTH